MDKKKLPNKYDSLDAVMNIVGEWSAWHIPENTEENRAVIEDGKYWVGVEFCRMRYDRQLLGELFNCFCAVQKEWDKEAELKKENKALRLALEWAVDCGFSPDDVLGKYEKFRSQIEGLKITNLDRVICLARMVLDDENNSRIGN